MKLNNNVVIKISILGMLLGLTLVIKYAFGFVMGVEFITFLFIVFGLMLPIIDGLLLVTSFNLLIIAIYGVGPWYLAYWLIWPSVLLISKLVSKTTKNIFIFSLVGALLSLWQIIIYFIVDRIFFGSTFAVSNIITALPVNLISSLCTMLAIIFIAPAILKSSEKVIKNNWNISVFSFNKINNIKLGLISSASLLTLSLSGISVLFFYNSAFINIKQNYLNNKPIQNNYVLPTKIFESTYKSLEDDEIAIAVLDTKDIYWIDKINFEKGQNLSEIMFNGKFDFYKEDYGTMGIFIKGYKVKGIHKDYQKNNVPLKLFYGNNFSASGVSSIKINEKNIFQFSYIIN